ncbi:hypothetical protein DFH09DRAFT_1401145 [Mycena vulgaris]|nr:hypothetical protein DFH09DRAFT_1401145 [Mycena vulgaris]
MPRLRRNPPPPLSATFIVRLSLVASATSLLMRILADRCTIVAHLAELGGGLAHQLAITWRAANPIKSQVNVQFDESRVYVVQKKSLVFTTNSFQFFVPSVAFFDISLAVLAVASPAFSAPVPTPDAHSELEARLSLPAGAVKDLLKSLGSGILTDGAFSGLLALLGGGDDAAPAARDLDARAGLGALLEKLFGVGEEALSKVLKNAVIGGVAGGVAVEGVNTAAGQRRAAVPVAVVEGTAKAASKGLGSIIGSGLASGLGSALGGLGIGAILDKLFNKRAFEDLNDDEVNTLLEYINDMQYNRRALADLSDEEVVTLLEYVDDLQNGKRALPSIGSLGKGIAGLAAGLAATQGAEAAIEQLKALFGARTISLNELD